MSAILDYFRYVGEQLKSIRAVDVLDILLVAFVFYYIFQFMRKRRAGKLLVGVVLLIVLLLISEVAKMKALNFILTNVFSVGILSLIVVFQPELRSFLEKVGGTTFHNFKGKLDKNQDAALRSVVNEVCIAADYFSKTRTGALIVFERETKLGDQAKTGTVVNADVSSYLLENIFFNKSPLHDGAVIISDGRLHAAGCLLPLSANENLIRELGTRHRAGIGMSENSDAIVVVVSEETGTISMAHEGTLHRNFHRDSLRDEFRRYLVGAEESGSKKAKTFFSHVKAAKSAAKGESIHEKK